MKVGTPCVAVFVVAVFFLVKARNDVRRMIRGHCQVLSTLTIQFASFLFTTTPDREDRQNF